MGCSAVSLLLVSEADGRERRKEGCNNITTKPKIPWWLLVVRSRHGCGDLALV